MVAASEAAMGRPRPVRRLRGTWRTCGPEFKGKGADLRVREMANRAVLGAVGNVEIGGMG